MKVFKFGGASVKDAPGVRNLAEIVRTQGQPAVVVISAMGKTTNALERIVRAYTDGQTDVVSRELDQLRTYHTGIMGELEGDFSAVGQTIDGLANYLSAPSTNLYDETYDQIVSLGEIISTQIVAAYLTQAGISTRWVDARLLIRTDATFREGRVDWDETSRLITETISTDVVTITQGFIGQTVTLGAPARTTTLGREGSDYTAAIFAYCLDAESVTIWKDVPGVLNADPKWFDDTVLLEKLTYQDAIELAYYGATVIHPKTIKPLQNKNIPLYVRSFLKPDAPGTVIGNFEKNVSVPSFIFKVDQVLISLHPNDFSFIAEDNLSRIFGRLAQIGVKINLMQNTAISFSVVVDNTDRVPALLDQLKQDFRVSYNDGLELVTIRYYDQATIDRVLVNKKLLLEQKSRNTVQLVAKDLM
ncbi:aspartate kinase [Spirosoma utsteinense]|uniref:Aspartokinase n=1 Tax=Spirosoma utsteinense TaxID=2585773 RepID=A0ABR6W224_9BACT|nr:aspartate kinase [Spirosoma utsteinense]MBC3783691.1 aspartate kinase [Spirosoma utsteinense]MBC3790166.1 aspartate kinase [Spirosoma utsteinense]